MNHILRVSVCMSKFIASDINVALSVSIFCLYNIKKLQKKFMDLQIFFHEVSKFYKNLKFDETFPFPWVTHD